MARFSDRCCGGVGVDGAAAGRATNTVKPSALAHINGDDIRAARGRLRVIYSRRHVERKVREAVGDAPKTIITPQQHSSPMRFSVLHTTPVLLRTSRPGSGCEDPRGACDERVGGRL